MVIAFASSSSSSSSSGKSCIEMFDMESSLLDRRRLASCQEKRDGPGTGGRGVAGGRDGGGLKESGVDGEGDGGMKEGGAGNASSNGTPAMAGARRRSGKEKRSNVTVTQ